MFKWVSLIVLFCLYAAASGVDITFDAANVSHPFYGFGAQVWPGDSRVGLLTDKLSLKYYRISPGGCTSPPSNVTTAVMDAYVSSVYSGTTRGYGVEYTLQLAETFDVKVIFIKFGECPSTWLGSYNMLKSEYFDDLARVWASEVLYFKNLGYTIDYIELFNEPEGNWNVYCPPSSYNTVVKLVRAELDSRGLNDVGIVGPGLAFLINGYNWISQLDANAKNAIAAWSTHAWDEGLDNPSALPEFLDQRWQDYFGAAVDSADPCHLKPIIVTEYATGVRTYNGVTYDPNKVCDSNQFAQRCYENSLTLVNNGANVLCYWEAANQSWQDNGVDPMYGFVRINSTFRPVYNAFMTLTPYIPDDAMVLTKTWDDSVISAAGFIKDEQLVLAFANSSANAVQRTIKINGVSNIAITNAKAFVQGNIVDKKAELSFDMASGTMVINLPKESTLTVAAVITECSTLLQSDLNDDCKVTFADFVDVASDWMKNNNSPGTDYIDDFQSYANNSELNAAWVIHTGGDPATETLETEGSNKCMKLLYNTNGSNGWLQTKHLLSGAVWQGYGINWNFAGYTDISFKYKITDQGSSLTQFTIWNSSGAKIAGADIGNGTVTSGWVTISLNLQTIKVAGANYGNVCLIGFTAKNTYYSGPTGNLYIDDVMLLKNGVVECTGEINGDVNGDCVVNFEDVYLSSQDWLECTLIEQSECW